ncbi:MAG: c-type cytochrome [Bryobacteraceae bacterium]
MSLQFRRLNRRFTLAAALLLASIPLAQATDPKTAEEVYKNIVQLKGTPADQLMPAMQFIAVSLGVECSFCHVRGKMDADDKPAKNTARDMMAMMAMINKTSFNGRQQVTCYSCHHGLAHPASVPPVLESDAAPSAPKPMAPPASGQGPTADEILEKYVTALGGADAIRKVTSRVEKGVILANGSESPVEVFTQAPNKRITVTHMGGGESFTAFDGAAGWMGNTGRPARDMSPQESWASSIDADFDLALNLKDMFPQIRRTRPETVNGVECETLLATAAGHPPVRFSFDRNSGLLVREVRYTQTPVGRMPAQIDYADYRDADGVKIPFRWTLSRPNGRFTIQIKEVQSNVEMKPGRFTKPEGEVH